MSIAPVLQKFRLDISVTSPENCLHWVAPLNSHLMAGQAQAAHDKIFSLLRTFFCFSVQDPGAQIKEDAPWGVAIVTCDGYFCCLRLNISKGAITEKDFIPEFIIFI